jgi:hypothetical protein
MPYVSSFERLARQEGREEGREEGLRNGLLAGIAASLQSKFGLNEKRLMPKVRKIDDVARLRAILELIPGAATLDDVRSALR